MTIFIFTIMILYLFYDIKYRRVSNHFFFLFLLLGFLSSLTEVIINLKQFRIILLNKVMLFIIFLYITLYLFRIKILGGADCKFLILIFICTPYTNLSYNFYLFFYFFFLIFYFGLTSASYMIKRTKKIHPSFDIFFETYGIHNTLKRIFFRIYFIFKDLVKVKTLNKDKYYFVYSGLVFNYSSFKLQILFQYRAPLIPLFILAYISCSFMILN